MTIYDIKPTNDNKSADHEDLVSPGYTIAWALAGFALFCMIIGAVVMKLAMGG